VLVLLSYVIGPTPMTLQILAGRRDDAHRRDHGVSGDEQRVFGVIGRCAGIDGLSYLCHDPLPAAAPGAVKGRNRWPRP
jgi:hypothetical protein